MCVFVFVFGVMLVVVRLKKYKVVGFKEWLVYKWTFSGVER